ncbi:MULTISPECIES: hypothetical protein [unclassified Priestia]|uniref:hypothetical protein n=1 Tax=unclassified Priestia TaxID=2800374 RepID=UPI00366CEA8D
MFTGFSLETDEMFSMYKSIGEDVIRVNKEEVGEELSKFISTDGRIDGTKMQDNWFPKVKADIFLSHSHLDRDKALGLAGWLRREFNLKVFIDSSVWGFADDLLKQIDDEYCRTYDNTGYVYEKRNYSTSHVHSMLTTALLKMIHNTECLLFLNTPKSIRSKEVIEQTMSPWIYMELAMSKLVEQVKPDREFLIKKAYEVFQEQKSLAVTYDVEINHLERINQQNLNKWIVEHTQFKNLPVAYRPHALDILYKQCKLVSVD